MTVKPWIQSLLLTSGHHPSSKATPGLFSDDEVVSKFSYPSISSLPTESNSVQTTSTTQMGVGRPLAEIVNEQGVFWPLTQHATRSRIEILGNGCIVPKFPARVSFVLSAIVCGAGNIDFSWIIEEISDQNGSANQLLASSSSKSLYWYALATFAPLSANNTLKVSMVKESISIVFERSGLYFVVAKLNDTEHGRIPLSVTGV